MAISEHDRHHLFVRLEEEIGPQAAATLMEHLPPVGWADVATKHDLATSETVLRADTQALRADMHALRAELKGDVAELKGDIAELRGEMRDEMGKLRLDIGRHIVFAIVGSNLTVAAIAFGSAFVR